MYKVSDMENIHMENTEELKSHILNLLDKVHYPHEEESSSKEILNFLILCQATQTGKVSILQRKGFESQIEIGTSVKFAEEHQEMYKRLNDLGKNQLKIEILHWTLPRLPEIVLNFDAEIPHYIVLELIYDGSLTLDYLITKIRNVVHVRELVKIRIQQTLPALVKETKFIQIK